jgi:N-acetyl-gamma-glutamyl-phosphate reductase
MSKVRVGIIGAAGYTAGELIRVLIHHPQVEISWIQSESQNGKKVYEIHTDLIGDSELEFINEFPVDQCEIVFLCKGHGESKKILSEYPKIMNKKIIDLSHDFRLKGEHSFVYGLPELNREKISSSFHIANPGCFATSIQLGLLPLANNNVLDGEVHISGITGSTGAGQKLSMTSHFSWRSNNASVYKEFEHQHLHEIAQSLSEFTQGFELNFIPYRGAFTRGIITTTYLNSSLGFNEVKEMYNQYYRDHPFTSIIETMPDVKMVVNSNKCLVYPNVINRKVVIVSVIDNLLKGASGQAVQNLNLISGFDETMGLKLKTSSF